MQTYNIILYPIYYFIICFAPGILIFFKLKIKTNFFSLISYSLLISFLFNYLLIFALILSGIFLKDLFFIYIVFVFLLFIKKRKLLKDYLIKILIKTFEDLKLLLNQKKLTNLITIVFSIVFLSIIIQNVYSDIHNNGQVFRVFTMQDVVYQYDYWSKEYYVGIIPETSFLKPQLMSASLSFFYIFLGSKHYEFAPLIFYSTIPFFFVFASVSYAIINKNLLFLPTAFLAIIFLYSKTFGQAFSGHMEIILGLWFFILLLFFSEFKKLIYKDKKLFFILFLIVTSCAFIKELAWINLAILFLFTVFTEKKYFFKNIKEILIYCIIFFLFIFSFYLYQYYEYGLKGNFETIFKLLTFDYDYYITVHNWDESILNFKSRVVTALNKFSQFIIIPFLGLFLIEKKSQILKIFILITIVQTLFWINFTSFYYHYLYISYFFVLSFGYLGLIEFFIKIIKKKFFLFLCLMSLLIISIIVIKEKTPDKNKILNKITKKKIALNFNNQDFEEINYFFYNYFINSKNKEKIITNYPTIYSKNIPLFEENFIYQKNIIESKNQINNFNYIFIFRLCDKFIFEKVTRVQIVKKFKSDSCLLSIF